MRLTYAQAQQVHRWARNTNLTIADRDNSPSLDRIIPSMGYVPGNIMVISYRANRIKNDASLEELERIAASLRAMIGKSKRR